MTNSQRSEPPGRLIARRVVVRGVVQRVGFRAATRRQARAAGVTGWVRNCPDGAVEAWIEGEEAPVAAVLDWLAEGPQHARVTDRAVTQEEPQGYSSFDIQR